MFTQQQAKRWKLCSVSILILSICFISKATKIKHISKKPVTIAVEKRVRKQYPVPTNKKWKEMPFVETNSTPKLTKAEKQRGYIIFYRPITETVYQNTKPQWFERIDYLGGFAAQGEFEPLTFSIYPMRELKNFKVKISDLKYEGNVISADNVDIRLATYWKLRYPHYTSANTYRYLPELLEKVNVHSSPAKECQRYWITVNTPQTVTAGIYTGVVTLNDDGFGKSVIIPIKFRVMGYRLKKDPNKHYSAFVYDLHSQIGKKLKTPEEMAWVKKAIANDYKAMKDFGFDMPPVLRLEYDPKTDKIFLPQDGAAIEKFKKAGIKGAVPVFAGIVLNKLYAKHTGRKLKCYPHCILPEMPKEDYFEDATRIFKEFELERKEKGWPDFIYLPLDEVAVQAKKYGEKCYKALKDAGCKLFITKRPSAADASVYAPYVDIFCSQPFAVDYAKTQNSKHEYWCYPNHNAGEVKKPEVMCKGGRMTYGFGLWRSGYTTLIPWIWRWDHKSRFKFDYLSNKRFSETGTQIDENGEVILTPYWMCFREGIDDTRYLYTLQSAILERNGSKNPECAKLVKDGKKLIQSIWDNIKPQQKYEINDMWPSSEFNAIRWKMASLIEELLKFSAVKKASSPSVIADTSSKKKKTKQFFDEQIKKGNIEVFDLGSEKFKKWKSATKEGTTFVTRKNIRSGEKALKYKVKIDHKGDGGGEKSSYPIGWPRIEMFFPTNSMDMTRYDYLSMWIMVDSDRDEMADDYTHLALTISSWDKKAPRYLYKTELLGAVPQKTWLPILIPIKKIISKQGSSSKAFWKNIKKMGIFLAEGMYDHGIKLEFYLDDISLIRMKQPAIKSISLSRYVILPEKYIVANLEIMGLRQNNTDVKIYIVDTAGNIFLEKTETVNKKGRIIMDIAKLLPGKYKLKVSFENNPNSSITEKFEAINGPLNITAQ